MKTKNYINICLSKADPLGTTIFPVSAWTFIPPQAEIPAEDGKEILTFHHEGFFWRCWFFGEGHPESIWSFWYSEYNPLCTHSTPPAEWETSPGSSRLWGMLRQFVFHFCHPHLLSEANLAHSFCALSVLILCLGFCSQRAVHRNDAISWGHLIYHLQSGGRRTFPSSPPSQYLLVFVFSKVLGM